MTKKRPLRDTLEKLLYFTLGFVLMYLILTAASGQIQSNRGTFELQLPLSMAKEPLLISSCGQTTDAYLMQDLLTELRMDHQFIPQANPDDLTNMATLLVAIGYSPTGLDMIKQSYDAESARVDRLVKAAEARGIPIIAVYLGGGSTYRAKNLKLIEVLLPSVDRLILMNEGTLTRDLQKQASAAAKDIVLIDRIEDLKSVIISSLR